LQADGPEKKRPIKALNKKTEKKEMEFGGGRRMKNGLSKKKIKERQVKGSRFKRTETFRVCVCGVFGVKNCL